MKELEFLAEQIRGYGFGHSYQLVTKKDNTEAHLFNIYGVDGEFLTAVAYKNDFITYGRTHNLTALPYEKDRVTGTFSPLNRGGEKITAELIHDFFIELNLPIRDGVINRILKNT